MSTLAIISLVILWAFLVVVVLMLFKGADVEDKGANVANDRVDSIRQSLDGDRTELRASDFAELDKPHPHVRAGTAWGKEL